MTWRMALQIKGYWGHRLNHILNLMGDRIIELRVGVNRCYGRSVWSVLISAGREWVDGVESASY